MCFLMCVCLCEGLGGKVYVCLRNWLGRCVCVRNWVASCICVFVFLRNKVGVCVCVIIKFRITPGTSSSPGAGKQPSPNMLKFLHCKRMLDPSPYSDAVERPSLYIFPWEPVALARCTSKVINITSLSSGKLPLIQN